MRRTNEVCYTFSCPFAVPSLSLSNLHFVYLKLWPHHSPARHCQGQVYNCHPYVNCCNCQAFTLWNQRHRHRATTITKETGGATQIARRYRAKNHEKGHSDGHSSAASQRALICAGSFTVTTRPLVLTGLHPFSTNEIDCEMTNRSR